MSIVKIRRGAHAYSFVSLTSEIVGYSEFCNIDLSEKKTISSNQCWDDSMIPFFVFIECQNIGNNEDRKDDEFQDV